MYNDETTIVDTKTIVNKNAKYVLSQVCEDLKERGHDPVKQIVAYLISGDPGYISSYKECRNRMLEFKREDLLEILLVEYLK